ncbi:MAG TPA: PAS domain S-box protein [Thermosynechococcaceae cyanobacterium]
MLHETVSSETLWHQAPIGILQLGLDGGITHANPAFCKLVGYTEAQLRRLDHRAISHPEDFAAEVQLLQQMIDHGQRQQALRKRYQQCDGSIVWTEVNLSLIPDNETSEGVILCFVTNVTDRRLREQEVWRYREREALLADISLQLRATTSLQDVMQDAVERLRQTLVVDRVLAYQFFPDQSGVCLVEAVAPRYPSMQGQTFASDCVPSAYLDAYRDGRLWAATDILDEDLSDCHKDVLENAHVRGMMVAAIVSMDAALEPQKRTLWGLLAVHCRAPRLWAIEEQRLLQVVATQLAIAAEQNQLLQSLQQRAHDLEDRVSERTRSLAQALKFEQLVHHLTETLRQHLDADQVLQAAVEGLTQILNLDRCAAGLISTDQACLTIRYESIGEGASLPALLGESFSWQYLPTMWSQMLKPPSDRSTAITRDSQTRPPTGSKQAAAQSRSTAYSSTVQPSMALSLAEYTSPIRDDQGLLGILTVCRPVDRSFAPDEIALIEQVASQCAIALRQADLHHQKHDLRVSADYFRSFLATSTDVFVEYDASFRCLSINPAGSTMLALAPEAIVGKTNQELFGDTAAFIDSTLQRTFETGEKAFVDYELLLPQGRRIFETVYTPITAPSGAVQRVVGVSRDVTELKQQWQLLEQQNQQLTETTRIKQEFIATTSHELRTPLTAVLGFSNVLLQGFFGTLNTKQQDYVERIHESGQHLLDLINDILDLSRLEAERLELDVQAIFVADICEGVMGLIRERALNQGLKLDIDLDASIDWIVVDPRRLKQMLLNLLVNAIKFTQEGTVGLKVYRQSLPHCAHALTATEPAVANDDTTTDMIHFLVWDTGIGIDAVNQQKLFLPFSQIDSSLARQHQGTGLGLVITRKLAELHGGTVTLESSPNEGARFTISLPFRQAV